MRPRNAHETSPRNAPTKRLILVKASTLYLSLCPNRLLEKNGITPLLSERNRLSERNSPLEQYRASKGEELIVALLLERNSWPEPTLRELRLYGIAWSWLNHSP